MPSTIEIHGLLFAKTGICDHKKCHGCEHECSVCPHGLQTPSKRYWYCGIQETKTSVCDICTNDPESVWYNEGEQVTHQICEDFPSHPFLYVIHHGICAIQFALIVVDQNDRARLDSFEQRYTSLP